MILIWMSYRTCYFGGGEFFIDTIFIIDLIMKEFGYKVFTYLTYLPSLYKRTPYCYNKMVDKVATN